MHVHLVRHGEVHNPDRVVYADLPGFGLSERGRLEAQRAAEYLTGFPIEAVYASPLQRAQETAAIIATAVESEIITRPDLTEWKLSQLWKGVRWDDLPQQRPGQVEAYLGYPAELPFSPESAEELGQRVAVEIKRAAGAHTGDVVVVSHQDPIQAGRLALLGLPFDRLHDDKPGHGDVLTFSPWVEVRHWRPEVPGESPPEWPPTSR